MWPRILLSLMLASGFVAAWKQLDRIRLQVVGQPSVTGVIQRQEQAFFEQLAATTGLPLDVSYTPTDQLGIKDTYQLLMLKSGALDLVSLRFLQNATAEPELLGVDLLGVTTDFSTARAVVQAYAPILDRTLQAHFNAKLLGIWPFGPQVFFCKQPVASLADLSGLKIRVGNENFGPLIAAFGGTPAVIPFEDVRAALKEGLVDCAITSATSGNAAGWPEFSTHFFGLGTQMGLNGYLINLSVWNRLSQGQQDTLTQAFEQHVESIWLKAEQMHADMSSCNVGGPCAHGVPYHLSVAEPSAGDYQQLRDVFERTTFRDWAERCDRVHPGCSAEWRQRVAPVLPLPMAESR